MAINHGASALGFVSQMPSGPGIISDTLISNISKTIPPFVTSILLTSKRTPKEIIEQHHRCKTNAIQICDHLDVKKLNQVSKSLPGVDIIQVIHVQDSNSIIEAVEVSNYVDGILLDSGTRDGTVIELGGTGRTHNWDISKKIVEKINVPVILAGGLNSNNIKEAVSFVQPYAVDICSGVRTRGKLDSNKLKSFMEIIKHF
jgi:phosphoribosylanthranilate isomerase